jgi:hypothetical protein
MRASYDA